MRDYLLLGALLWAFMPLQGHAATDTSLVQSVTLLTDNGGRVDWSPQNLIAFDRRGPNGYYDVWTMNPDGTGQTCLTCNKPDAPRKNKGNPAWHPSGHFIVFEGQHNKSSSLVDHLAEPGRGVANDLWIMDAAGNYYWKLVDTQKNWWNVTGVLHPHFSRDGTELFWGQLTKRDGPLGDWDLHIADFSVQGGVPALSNVRTLQLGEPTFYESHGFTPDGRQVLFTGKTGDKSSGEYLLDLASGGIRNLTEGDSSWNEHGQINPNGRRIVWASTRGDKDMKDGLNLWLMNIGGSNPREAVDFHDPSLPYFSKGIGPADSSWSPDGKKLAVYDIADSDETKGSIYVVEFASAP